MKKTHVLVVDDEPRYCRLLQYNLEAAGYSVECVYSGEECLALFETEKPDLIVLDIFLPGIDGYEVCTRIREKSYVPIIMLTALGEEEQIVRGLRCGADDYVTKPFSAMELMARIETVLRRNNRMENNMPSTATIGDIEIDFLKKEVKVNGDYVKFSPTEFRLLQYLASRPGRLISQEEILENVWGASSKTHYEGLRIYIWRLRQKIEKNPENPEYIITRPGEGYIFAEWLLMPDM